VGYWDIGYGIWDMGYRIWDMGYGIWDMGYGIWGLDVESVSSDRTGILYIIKKEWRCL